MLALAAALLLIPVSDLAIAIVQKIANRFVWPETLPRLELIEDHRIVNEQIVAHHQPIALDRRGPGLRQQQPARRIDPADRRRFGLVEQQAMVGTVAAPRQRPAKGGMEAKADADFWQLGRGGRRTYRLHRVG
jgi:hypothetical protein